MFLKKILFTALISSFFLISCSDSPTDQGGNLLGGDSPFVGTINSTTDSISQTSSIVEQKINTFSSTSLLLGKSLNVEAASLMRFFIILSDTLAADIKANIININESTVELTQNYTFGDENLPLNYSVHEATYFWKPLTFTSDSLSRLTYDASDISFDKTFSDSLNSFKLSTDMVKNWLNAAADTTQSAGIYLKPDPSSQKVVGFQAFTSSSSAVPVIKIVIEKPGVYLDTLTFISLEAVSVVTGDLPPISPENIAVQSGLTLGSKLFFDLSNLPADISINSAELILTLDTLETVTGSAFDNSLHAFYLGDSTDVDSILGQVTLTIDRSLGTVTGDVSAFVRNWVDTKINYGMLLKTFNPAKGVELFVIKGSNAPAGLKPELKIIYSRIAQ